MPRIASQLRSFIRRARADAIDVIGDRLRAGINAFHAPYVSPAAQPIASEVPNALNAEALGDALRALGVEAGDTLLVHASLAQLCGRIPTAADLKVALRGLRNALGDEGTLVMATQSIRNAYVFARERRIFEPDRHVSIFGALTEGFRKMESTIRSRNPWCNLAAQGPIAAELMAGHEDCSPFAAGVGSPWHRMALSSAKIAFLGVDIMANTSFIVPQHILGHNYPVPVFVDKPLVFRYRRADGTVAETAQLLDVHDWGKDQVRAYARYLDLKYRLYRTARFGSTTITVCCARNHLDAMLNEVDLGNFYSRPDWRMMARTGASS